MSGMKHSPGPWRRLPGISCDVWAGKKFIATTDVEEYTTGRLQRRANAHLIAAAPEMLEALEMALEYLHERASLRELRQDRLSRITAVGEAAIAKAKGESSR